MIAPPDIEIQCRFWQQVEKTPTCWNWCGALSHGYGRMKIEKQCYLTHRLSYYWHYGKDPIDFLVMHLCNNRKCVNPDHLLLGTYSDNIRHAFDSGQRVDGIFAVNHSLTEYDVRFIRKSNYDTHILARAFGVCRNTIQDVRNRKTYCRVKD